MNKRTALPLLIIILTVLIISEAHATGKGSYKRAFRKDCIGTWVNPEYSKWTESRLLAKRVVKSDSLLIAYEAETSEWPFEIELRIDNMWIDDQGYIYYKIYTVASGGFVYHELWRIDESKDTLEINWYAASYPDEINPKSGYYLIYYRQ